MRKAKPQALIRAVFSAGQHHLGHSVGAENASDPNASAASDKDTAPPLRQLEDHRGFGNTHMGRRGDFEPPANHRAAHGADDGQPSELNLIQDPMPASRVINSLFRGPGPVLFQIQPGAVMSARSGQHHGFHRARRIKEERAQLFNKRIRHGVAFFGPVHRYGCDAVCDIDLNQGHGGHRCARRAAPSSRITVPFR